MEALIADAPNADDQISIIRMLLERMNTVDKKLLDLSNVCGFTALHWAAERTSWRVLDELLNWGPNIFCQTSTELYTVLHQALNAKEEPKRMSNLRCLVEHANGYGLDGINIPDKQGCTVLHLALKKNATNSNSSIVDYLSTKVDVSIQDVKGNTPLHIAMNCDDSEVMIQMLLRSRHATEAVNTRNGHGRTPLHDAILLNNTNLVHAIGQIADVNIRSSHDGKIALHYAVMQKARHCLYLLLMLSANVSV